MSYTTEDILMTVIESSFSRYSLQEFVDRLAEILVPHMPVAGLRCNLYANKAIYKVVEYRRSDYIVPTPDVLRIPEDLLIQFNKEVSVASNAHVIKVINSETSVPGYQELLNIFYGGPAENIYLPLERNNDSGAFVFITIYTLSINQYTQRDVDLCKLLQRSLQLALNRILQREKIDWKAFVEDPQSFRFDSKSGSDWIEAPGGGFLNAQEEFVSLDEYIKNYIIKAIRHTRGRIAGKKGAAQLLGMPISTLWSKIRKYNISVSSHLEE